jgi:hypothetical protein
LAPPGGVVSAWAKSTPVPATKRRRTKVILSESERRIENLLSVLDERAQRPWVLGYVLLYGIGDPRLPSW